MVSITAFPHFNTVSIPTHMEVISISYANESRIIERIVNEIESEIWDEASQNQLPFDSKSSATHQD
jgi:hypothetical protein